MYDWNDLRIFITVSRSHTLAEASRQLALDATTIARRISRLSDDLQAQLFEGNGPERRLTEAGQKLLRYAERIEDAALAAAEEVTGERQSLSGQVRLSVSEGFATCVLAPRLHMFAARHPGIRLDIITAYGFLNPSKREADMAVMLARPKRGRATVRKLGDYRLHLYAAHSYLASRGAPASTAALSEHPLVGYVPEFLFSPELNYLDEVEPGLEATLRSSSINVQHQMIAQGAGIGVLPDFMGETNPLLCRVLPDGVEIQRTFWLVTHAELARLARIEAVSSWLGECAAALRQPRQG